MRSTVKRTPVKTKPVARRSRGHDYEDIMKKIGPVGKIKKPMRIALYGRAGSGKTTLAATFPKPLLLDIGSEEGTDSVSDVVGLHVVRINTWEEFEQIYWFLLEGDHEFETVIIDTVTQVQEIAVREVSAESKKSADNPGGWGSMTKQQWGEVATMLKTWVTNYRNLPDMNIVFIGQERIFNGGDEAETDDGQIAPEVGPRLMPSVVSTLNAAVDILANCFIREKHTRKKVNGKFQEKREVQYCLRIGPHAYYTTKVRKPRSVEVPGFLVDPNYEDLVELKTGE